MAERIVSKSLAGLEDLLLGNGTEQQIRNGYEYPITKLSLPWACSDIAELLELDTTKFTQALVSGITYKYNGSAWVQVGGLEVTAESFGVVDGLVSQAVAKTNAYKIMAKAAELSAAGGGKIVFTKSLYQVHMDEADFSSSAATFRVAALKIPFDNVILCGQGWTATTIQAYATNSAYGVVQWTETPQENGITKVKGVGLHDICIDGNYHGDFTPGSYVRQLEGVLGAGIEGLNISRLKVKNCSHYGMGLQNGGYKGCSIDGYWSENTGADGIDIKDNGSVSRAFQLNNIFVFNFGQLNEPLNPWAGVDIMSVAPKVSNVYVSDFGDKGVPGAGVRIKQGPIGDLAGRGTGGVWANITNITVVQNRFGVTEPIRGLHIKSPFVNYSNIVTIGYDGGRLKTGVYIEERHTKGSNVQIANAENGVMITGSTSGSAEGREYGDGNDAAIVGITCRDVLRAFDLQRKYTNLVAVTLKDCAVGFAAGGSGTGPVTIKGLHLDGVTDPFGQMGGSFHKITDVTGPDSVNWQAGIGILKSATDFVVTAILSRLSVRLYTGSTDSAVGTEVARFMPASSTVFSSLVVAGNVQSSAPNTNTVGTGPTPWAGGFTQTAFTVTSDERYKTAPEKITEAMLDAAAEVDWCMFQYLDRVEVKGEDLARWHFGAMAQHFVAAFERHGLDPYRFAFICYDEWGDSPELIGEDGEVISPTVNAGSRYGIRYDQAIILKQKQVERDYNRRLDALVAKIEALEAV